jgi:hypothetical protein
MTTPNKEGQFDLEKIKSKRLEDYPHLVEQKKKIEDMIFGTTEYWKNRAIFLEKQIDPTYSDFERSNCRNFYLILVNKQI